MRFGEAEAEVKFLTHKELQAVTPRSAVSGAVTVEVVNPDGVSAALPGGFVM